MSIPSSEGDVTRLLARARAGDDAALDELYARVYEELHAIAEQWFRAERPGHTLQPTAIVNEAWLKMVGSHGALDTDIERRSIFLAASAKAMQEILIDYAKMHNAKKRGGGAAKMLIQEGDAVADPRAIDILALRDALQRFSAINRRAAQVVEMRYFSGCTVEETATTLGVSPETVNNDWRFAKAWLSRELKDDE